MTDYLATRGPYLLFVALQVVGSYLLLSHRNLMKAVVGLYLFQSGIILFFILLAFRFSATVPIHLHHDAEVEHPVPMINPLPHALMLTAIVVGVATLGVGLGILRRIQAEIVTIEDRAPEER